MSITTMDSPEREADPSELLTEARTAAAAVRHLIGGNRTTWWVPYIVWGLAGAVAWRQGLWILVAGVALHSLAQLGLVGLRVLYDRAPDARPAAYWLNRYRLVTLLFGLNWGVCFLLLLAGQPLLERVYLYAILAVQAAVAVPARSIDPQSFRAMVLPMILLPLPSLAWPGETVALATAAGGLIYALGVDLVAREQRRILLEQERLIVANERLTADALRERAEATAAREGLQLVLDNMDDGLMLFDADFRWEMINRQLMEFQRFTPEVAYPGASGQDIIRFQALRGDFGPVDDLEKVIDERVAAMRKPGGNRYMRRTASGRWIDFHFKPLPDGRLLAMYRDVSDLKEGELELAAAREKMRAVLDNMGDGVALYAADGGLLFNNEAFGIFLGLSADVLAENGSVRGILGYLARRGDFGQVDDTEAEIERRYEALWAHDEGGYERSTASGRILEVRMRRLADDTRLATYRDITELKRGEAQLAETRAAMQLVLDNMGDGVALYDAKGDWRFHNGAFRRFLNLAEHEMAAHRNIGDIVRFQALRGDFGIVEDLEDLAEKRTAMFWASTRYARAAADGRFLEVESRTLADGSRLVTYRDITELKRSEERLGQVLAAAEAQSEAQRTLVENLPFGALLLDSELRIRASNSILIELVELPTSIATEGYSYKDAQRFLWERGEVGQGQPFEQHYADLVNRITAPGGLRYERETAGGRHIDARFQPLRNGWILATFVDVTEAKQREAELARARETLEDAIASLSDGFALHDENDRMVLRNARYGLVNGNVEAAMRIGDSYEAGLRALVAHWRAASRVTERGDDWVRQMVAAHHGGDSEREIHVTDGRWLRVAKRRTRAGGIVTVVTDISEAKRRELELEQARDAAEAARRETESTREVMHTVLDSMTDGVTFYEADGRLSYINAATMRFHKLSPEALRNLHTLEDMARFQLSRGDLGQIEDLDAEIKRRIAAATAPEGQTYYRRTSDGKYLEFRFLRVRGGGTLSIHRDITELKDKEEALARERAEAADARTRLVDAIESLPNGFVLFDADGRLVLANRLFLEYYAAIADICVPGMHIREMLTQAAIRGAVSTGGRSVEEWVERRMALRSNPGEPRETRQPNGRWVVIGERRTREGGFASIYTDISELKRREAELEQARDEAEAANQSKSTFLATMSHEIRTPMNGVLGMMEILERQGIAENQRRTVGTMRESAQALLRIIDDVLDFSRIEAGRLDLEEVEFSLAALVGGCVDTLRPQATKKRLTLAVEVEPGSHDALLGDPTRVRQLLFNLLGNALKFTERGSVTVIASATPLGEGDTEVKLVVRDTGIGMDGETVGRLFQPFAQADSSTTRRYGGSGLGLSIVRRLAQLMGGDVAVSSAPGLGSAFTVTLRIKAAPAESALRAMVDAAAPAARASRTTVSDARVLVVDDHPVNREVLAQQLLLLGIASDSAIDGAEGLAMWAPGRYAAILADMHMPVMDGFEMTRRLRATEIVDGGMRTPIVAVTANAMAGEAERCLAAGMDAFLAKPVSIEQLRVTLERWLPMDNTSAVEDVPAPEAAVFDPTVMGRLFGSDRKSIVRVLGTFVDSVREIEREIAAAARDGDTGTLAAAAHKLKGAARTAGAGPLGDVAASLEQSARGGDLERCRAALGPLATARRRALSAIEAWREEG